MSSLPTRNPDRLHRAQQHGADATVVLAGGTDVVSALRKAAGPHGIDVIIDPLWGEPALAAMHAVRREAYRSLTEHAARGAISIDVIQLPLADVASAWEQQKQGPPAKLVLIP